MTSQLFIANESQIVRAAELKTQITGIDAATANATLVATTLWVKAT